MHRVTIVSVIVLLALIGTSLGAAVDNVNLFIGTGGEGYGVGSTDVGAQVPFGAFRVGPDTAADFDLWLGFYHCSGYYYGDTHIRAFSHTRLVGAGVPDYGNVGVMPVTKLDKKTIAKDGYRSRFSHKHETPKPGYYSVYLETPKVFAEVAAAGTHAGFHRYSYSSGSERILLVDVCHVDGVAGDPKKQGPECRNATVDVVPSTDGNGGVITGKLLSHTGLSSRGPLGGVQIFFHMIVKSVEAPTTQVEHGVWQDNELHSNTTTGASNDGSLGVWFDFGTATGGHNGGGSVEVAVGISFVSIEQAVRNLEVQTANMSGFDQGAAAGSAAWEKALSVLSVAPSSDDENEEDEATVKMFTALYHSFSAPTTWTEVDGVYLGFDGKVHTSPSTLYTDMSIWDIHRSEAPWLNLVLPAVGAGVAESLETMSRQGGDVPRWPLANIYTGCMTGQHGHVMVVDAFVKNLTSGVDTDYMYSLMVNESTKPVAKMGRDQLDFYMSQGYVPSDKTNEASSKTLEYAYDDWVVSVMARMNGHDVDADAFLNRSLNYKNVFNNVTRFACPRSSNGTFACGKYTEWYFLNHDFTEGNAWQWTFFVPGDPLGLVQLFGTPEEFAAKLEISFAKAAEEKSMLLPNHYYWAGNEPDLLAPWLFPFAGRADLTQYWTRWLFEHRYNTKADGLPGNDDYGTMSAWALFAALGFYPVSGSPLYVIGAPAVPKASIVLGSSQGTISISTIGWTKKTHYVSAVKVNGVALKGPALMHSQIAHGADIEFTMSDKVSQWGHDFDWKKDVPEMAALWPK